MSKLDSEQLHVRILLLFNRFLQKDPVFKEEVSSVSGEMLINDEEWQFSLPALYVVCCTYHKEFEKIGYRPFRRLLYRFPTNKRLAPLGGCVMVSKQRKNINRTVYVLTRIIPPTKSV